MTEKRFAVTQTVLGSGIYDYQVENELCESYDEDAYMEVCKKLNELAEENEQSKMMIATLRNIILENEDLEKENKELKSILQDMGLIMSNEEVQNVRKEIASKLIKPLCERNGFDVDVNTEKGFTIIPNEANKEENKRFTIKPQDDLFSITDNNTADKVNVINGIRTEIEAEWLCDLMNELTEENQQLKKEITFFQKELRDCSWKSRELTLSEVEDAIKKIKKYE